MAYLRHYDDYGFYGKTGIPFDVRFSFKKLITYWEELAAGDDIAEAAKAKAVLEQVSHATEILEPFTDISLVEKYEQEISLLLSPMFPALLSKNEIKAACMPFMPVFYNTTQRLSNILDGAGKDTEVKGRFLNHKEMYISACVFILNFKYGAGINFYRPVYFDMPNEKTGIQRHYRAFINADFSSFHANENFPGITDEDIKLLTSDFDNLELWMEKFPPSSFYFEGFAIINLYDVTPAQAISGLKIDLLEKNALQSPDAMERIEQRLQSLLNISDLKLGFAVFDSDREILKSMGNGFMNSFTLAGKHHKKSVETFCNYSYKTLFEDKKTFVIPEISGRPILDNPLAESLERSKLKSYLATPLMYDDKVIGVLELGSYTPGALNSAVSTEIESVKSLFATALKRSVDELETQLEAIIQEECTAIHPTVSWRFFDAAEKLLEASHTEENPEMEEILFENVYPLYGQSDLKSSSVMRNEATQADLVAQMRYARKVLELAVEQTHLPIYQELIFRMEKYVKSIRKGLGAGDEVSVLEFLRSEIYPVFRQLETLNEELRVAVDTYGKHLDPKQGVVYDKRKDFEDSVDLINDRMDKEIDRAQHQAQEMFPHYFEKYKTDGVEHNIYIGQALVNNKDFHQVYLQNLRLWQLITLCEVENAVHELRPSLKVPLEICSLILVHSNPLSIKFRMDEKQFDVEGAYNIRYAIIKKRIDKAYIKGTTERLTQPHKIAIVYSQDRDAREYANYLEYLVAENLITPNIEWLELEDLQGVTGLRALRVEVVFKEEKKVKAVNGKAKSRQQVGLSN